MKWLECFAGIPLFVAGILGAIASYTGIGIQLPSEYKMIVVAISTAYVIYGIVAIVKSIGKKKVSNLKCPHCATLQESETYLFCQSCGKSLSNRPICQRCHLPIDSKKTYCGSCGEPTTKEILYVPMSETGPIQKMPEKE
jgi:uncharacterized paraquat-inducible protein A